MDPSEAVVRGRGPRTSRPPEPPPIFGRGVRASRRTTSGCCRPRRPWTRLDPRCDVVQLLPHQLVVCRTRSSAGARYQLTSKMISVREDSAVPVVRDIGHVHAVHRDALDCWLPPASEMSVGITIDHVHHRDIAFRAGRDSCRANAGRKARARRLRTWCSSCHASGLLYSSRKPPLSFVKITSVLSPRTIPGPRHRRRDLRHRPDT